MAFAPNAVPPSGVRFNVAAPVFALAKSPLIRYPSYNVNPESAFMVAVYVSVPATAIVPLVSLYHRATIPSNARALLFTSFTRIPSGKRPVLLASVTSRSLISAIAYTSKNLYIAPHGDNLHRHAESVRCGHSCGRIVLPAMGRANICTWRGFRVCRVLHMVSVPLWLLGLTAKPCRPRSCQQARSLLCVLWLQ